MMVMAVRVSLRVAMLNASRNPFTARVIWSAFSADKMYRAGSRAILAAKTRALQAKSLSLSGMNFSERRRLMI
jgi:hypothetical protein